MLPRDPLALPPVARTLAAGAVEVIGDPRQQAFQRALAGQLGKSMQGEVLARLADGSFVVRVAGTPARMQLPAGAQPGAALDLTLVALTPRPTFQVGPDGRGPATFTEAHAGLPGYDATGAAAGRAPLARAAALLANAPLTPSALLDGMAGDDGSPASLSTAARAIGSMLGAALKADGGASAIIGRTPLAAAPGADPRQLAAAVRDAIGSSGLFYESHVAEWAAGQRTLAELAAEPQMQAARSGAGAHSDAAGAQLVNLQLATHEQGQLAWQGLAWPGQPMRLEIGRDDTGAREGGAHGQDDDAGGGAWQSRLRLRFALLGEVAASIALSGGQLHLRLEAGSEAAGELLRAHAARLTGSLEAAGAPLSSLAIDAAKESDD